VIVLTTGYGGRVTDLLVRVGAVVLALVGVLVVVELVHLVMARIARRVSLVAALVARTRQPVRLVALAYTLDVALRASGLDGPWRGPVLHLVDLAAIGATAWLVTRLLFVVEDAALARFRTDVRDNRQARTVHTQVAVIRRFTAVAVAVLAVGTMLTTFHEVRLIGASLLASAGVAAAIAAFAANTLLGNVIAGLQLAFGKSLRLDDVVVIDDEWGRIEDITLTYIVLHVWDDRRLILPTSWFTSHPFENWTRHESSLLGSVELDVDWSVPADRMRDELRAILTETPMWDGRVTVLQVTDAVAGMVRVRALVSAADAPTLWDLRCAVRERLIGWLREHHPGALPRVRAEMHPVGPVEPEPHRADGDSRVFGGDAAGRRRARDFTGPEQPG
jgi:small-conductance mechanosensitive channel